MQLITKRARLCIRSSYARTSSLPAVPPYFLHAASNTYAQALSCRFLQVFAVTGCPSGSTCICALEMHDRRHTFFPKLRSDGSFNAIWMDYSTLGNDLDNLKLLYHSFKSIKCQPGPRSRNAFVGWINPYGL